MNFKFSIEKEPLRKLYRNPQLNSPRKRQRLDFTSPIISGKCASVLPFVKLPKDGMDMLIIRRPFGTISIPEQRIDVLTGVDVAPARRTLIGPILERFPASALPRLVEADGAGVVVAGVKGGIIRGAENVLAQRVEAVEGVGDRGGEGNTIAELQHRSSDAFL